MISELITGERGLNDEFFDFSVCFSWSITCSIELNSIRYSIRYTEKLVSNLRKKTLSYIDQVISSTTGHLLK